MGQIAARTVINQIEKTAEYVPEIAVEPELIIRASSGSVPHKDATARTARVRSAI
jgi:LacI family transcriptional regulator